MNTAEVKNTLLHKERYDIQDLLTLMELLRQPDGCPWDREQTHESIRQNLIEETYEVAEAIDLHSLPLLQEELGDLLLQVVFHAQMEAEKGNFTFADVVNGICKKLVERHPHVFLSAPAKDGADALASWDRVKQKEKNQKTVGESMDSIARTMPSLMRAKKIAHKEAKLGQAVENPYPDAASAKAQIGKDLFAICAAADAYHLDPEELLYRENERQIAQYL